MSERRHWYHCSEKFHGQRWVAERRTPDMVRLTSEPVTPRLCVASSVARCFAARLFAKDTCVYRTETERRAITPVDVHDSILTQERWLIPPVAMVLVEVIQVKTVIAACADGMKTIHRRIDNMEDPYLTPLEKLYSFRCIIEVLGEKYCDPIDRRFVNKSIAYLESRRMAVAS